MPEQASGLFAGILRQYNILLLDPGTFLQIAFPAGEFQIVESPFIAAVGQWNNVVNMKILAVHLFAAFHADTAIADIHNLANPAPVGLHEKIAQAAGAAEGMPIGHGSVAANTAKSSALGILLQGKAFFIGLAFAVTHNSGHFQFEVHAIIDNKARSVNSEDNPPSCQKAAANLYLKPRTTTAFRF